MGLGVDDRVLAVISGGDHDALMSAIISYEMLASYGDMDPDVEKWLTVIVLMPRHAVEIKSRALREDFGFDVTLCKTIDDAKATVNAMESWR